MIRVVLPSHLRTLARVDGEVELLVDGKVTQRSVLNALEARYPVLCGTIRDHGGGRLSGSSPVNKTSPTNCRTPRCPRP